MNIKLAFSGLLADGRDLGKMAPSLKSVTYPTMMKLGTVTPELKKI